MFDFFLDANNHEERLVDRYEESNVFVDTCAVSDSTRPYETAVAHPAYNGNKIIIVEEYDTKEDAQKGHDKWVKIITAKKLPRIIEDVSTSGVVEFAKSLGTDVTGPREKAGD